jgi:hypothetical protein
MALESKIAGLDLAQEERNHRMKLVENFKTFNREKFPAAVAVWRNARTVWTMQKLKGRPLEEIWLDSHHDCQKQKYESSAGGGSSLAATEAVRRRLPKLLEDLEVRSLLDIPCGDFHWMRFLPLPNVTYIGADIVSEVIAGNAAQYTSATRRFEVLNICTSALPHVDAILCRDCLIHLSNKDVLSALDNVKRSGARILITTTYPSVLRNMDIVSGSWRPLNLQREPVNLPEPMLSISEEWTGDNGAYSDKSLAVWHVSEIPDHSFLSSSRTS